MAQFPNQRVAVFVDVQNMYHSAKNLYHAKVNFKEILIDALRGRKLIRAIAYVIRSEVVKEEKNFFEALANIGFEIRAKDLQIFLGGEKKGDWDVGLAMDILKLAPKLDVVVLVSGDGDFQPLLEHVKALGCRAEVMAFRRTASSRLVEEADLFSDLDQDGRRFLITGYRRTNQRVESHSSADTNNETKKTLS